MSTYISLRTLLARTDVSAEAEIRYDDTKREFIVLGSKKTESSYHDGRLLEKVSDDEAKKIKEARQRVVYAYMFAFQEFESVRGYGEEGTARFISGILMEKVEAGVPLNMRIIREITPQILRKSIQNVDRLLSEGIDWKRHEPFGNDIARCSNMIFELQLIIAHLENCGFNEQDDNIKEVKVKIKNLEDLIESSLENKDGKQYYVERTGIIEGQEKKRIDDDIYLLESSSPFKGKPCKSIPFKPKAPNEGKGNSWEGHTETQQENPKLYRDEFGSGGIVKGYYAEKQYSAYCLAHALSAYYGTQVFKSEQEFLMERNSAWLKKDSPYSELTKKELKLLSDTSKKTDRWVGQSPTISWSSTDVVLPLVSRMQMDPQKKHLMISEAPWQARQFQCGTGNDEYYYWKNKKGRTDSKNTKEILALERKMAEAKENLFHERCIYFDKKFERLAQGSHTKRFILQTHSSLSNPNNGSGHYLTMIYNEHDTQYPWVLINSFAHHGLPSVCAGKSPIALLQLDKKNDLKQDGTIVIWTQGGSVEGFGLRGNIARLGISENVMVQQDPPGETKAARPSGASLSEDQKGKGLTLIKNIAYDHLLSFLKENLPEISQITYQADTGFSAFGTESEWGIVRWFQKLCCCFNRTTRERNRAGIDAYLRACEGIDSTLLDSIKRSVENQASSYRPLTIKMIKEIGRTEFQKISDNFDCYSDMNIQDDSGFLKCSKALQTFKFMQAHDLSGASQKANDLGEKIQELETKLLEYQRTSLGK